METENKIEKSNRTLLWLPIWLPMVYSIAVWLEFKFTHQGPLSAIGGFLLFAVPAIGGLPILTSSKTPILANIFLYITYYFFGVLIAGTIGWGLCLEMHTCA
ncbi:MAG: hypothetical protein WA123_11025 [Methylotenera sp.]